MNLMKFQNYVITELFFNENLQLTVVLQRLYLKRSRDADFLLIGPSMGIILVS